MNPCSERCVSRWDSWPRLHDMAKSAVACIVSSDGGTCVVIGPLENMWCHEGPCERAYVLFDVWVQEPVPLDDIPKLIERATNYAKVSVAMGRRS